MPQPAGFQKIVTVGGAGCFLAALCVFNLFFGWLFLKPRLWILVELTLVALLWVYNRLLLFSLRRAQKNREKVIDTDAEIIE